MALTFQCCRNRDKHNETPETFGKRKIPQTNPRVISMMMKLSIKLLTITK